MIWPKQKRYIQKFVCIMNATEPVAEAFGDLDPKIDARLADERREKGKRMTAFQIHMVKN